VKATNFFAELKRRNVYKVAVAYTVVGWLLIQVATQVFPFFEIPTWAIRLVVLVIAIGFPVALIIAWAFEADVLHTGDTWWNGHYPFIDYSTGGSIDGMIRAAEANVAAVTDKTIVIPGHGPIGNKSQLIEYRDVLAAIRDRIAALKREGESVNEIVAAKPTAAYDAKWGGFFSSGEVFTKLVYKGVGKDPAQPRSHS
jgi:hypothetical protein